MLSTFPLFPRFFLHWFSPFISFTHIVTRPWASRWFYPERVLTRSSLAIFISTSALTLRKCRLSWRTKSGNTLPLLYLLHYNFSIFQFNYFFISFFLSLPLFFSFLTFHRYHVIIFILSHLHTTQPHPQPQQSPHPPPTHSALHNFDCLRANKSTSAWGVEARPPFLDADFMQVNYAKLVCEVFIVDRAESYGKQ